MKKLSAHLALALLCSAATASQANAQRARSDSLLAHIRYLASDDLAGREAGTAGADSAAAYIARQMEAFGLNPLGNEGYLSSFDITTTVTILPDSRLTLQTPTGGRDLELYRDWLPFPFSSSGRVRGAAFDGGYGLEAESFGDPHGESLTGRVAVIRGGTPEGMDPHHGSGDLTPRFKITNARQRGAAAAIVTVDRIERPQPGDPPRSVGIPAAQVLETPETLELLEAEELLITLDAALEPVQVRAHNVLGYVEGDDPALREQVIVVGAHYDHLGMGGPGSLAPDARAPHNGADDNASGTALLLELARHFARSSTDRPARSLVFVAFSAEEMGLLGSERFVSRPPVKLERVTAMVNFDMVGRLRNGSLQIFGTETATEFDALLDSLDAASDLSITKTGDGYGPSDQTSFYARGIPVLHLFTGVHSEYHRPEDDWELINANGLAEISAFAIDLVRALGDRRAALTLVEQSRPTAGTGGGYGPYLGTIPDFSEVEGGGVRLSGVRADSPAERAGLQGGDIVVEFAGARILNLYDYTYALRASSPGDTVEIRVRRDGREVSVEAVLEERR